MKIEILKMVAAALVVVLAGLPAKAAEAPEGWLEDYAAALARAKAENKVVLVDLAGSDWSKDSQKQAKEVFAAPEFKDYAAKHLVLLQLDFPKSKDLPKEIQDQNSDLRLKFGIRTLPATVVLDAAGNVLGKWTGYAGGGPAQTIAKVEGCRAEPVP